MTWVWVVAALLALLLGLLAVPLQIAFSAAMDLPQRPLTRSLRFRWGFGLIDVAPAGRRAPTAVAGRPRPTRRQPARVATKSLLRRPAFWRHLASLLRRLLRRLRVLRLRLDATVGLDDPADTGILWGATVPALVTLLPSHAGVAIRPHFAGPACAFDAEGEVRLIPLLLLGVLLRFAVAPTTWRILWSALRR